MRRLIFLLVLISFTTVFGEPVKAENEKALKFFELYGYFAFNHEMSYNYILNGNNPYMPTTPYLNNDLTDASEKLLSWATIKLHLEPVINIAETMEIHSKFSIFGNKVLGNDNVIQETRENGMLISTQLEKSYGITVEGLWGTLDTPIGELKVGRMPFNWGLGMLFNSGNTPTSQSPGDYVDRLELVVPISGFRIIPALDFNSEGAMMKYQDHYIDASQRDDGWQLSAMFTKQEDDAKLLEEKLLKENTLFEFGAMLMYSWKYNMGASNDPAKTTQDTPIDGNLIDPAKQYVITSQNGKLWTVDGWVNFYYKNFSIKAELAYLAGTIGKYTVDAQTSHDITASMVGAAIEAEYKLIPRKLNFKLLGGIASPDDASGVMGDSTNMPGKSISRDAIASDMSVDNFRFHRDYNINSTIWNKVLGRFTAGYYLSLEAKYFFSEEIRARGGLTYTAAFSSKNSLYGQGTGIGLEPFVGAEYWNKSGLRAGIDYQLSLPFDGLRSADQKTDLLHMLHTYVAFVF